MFDKTSWKLKATLLNHNCLVTLSTEVARECKTTKMMFDKRGINIKRQKLTFWKTLFQVASQKIIEAIKTMFEVI